MKVLVGCEESGVVRRAFRDAGHTAFSCDLLPTRDDSIFHFQKDVFEVIAEKGPWDLIILHPPCTALAVSGNRWYGRGTPRYYERLRSLGWTKALWDFAVYSSERVAMENPVGVIWRSAPVYGEIPPPQYIQPWQFGHGETKKTGLALHNLPELKPTNIVEGREARVHRMPPGKNRARDRSETYQGIADAMADQWGRLGCQKNAA